MFQIQLDTFVGVERILLVRFAVMAAHPAIFVKAPCQYSPVCFCSQYSPHITTIFTLLHVHNIHPSVHNIHPCARNIHGGGDELCCVTGLVCA